MALTEEEEFELLSLEREKYMSGQQVRPASQQPTPSIATEGASYLTNHPFKSLFEGGLKTATGKGMADRVDESVGMGIFTNSFDTFGNNPIANANAIARATMLGTGTQIAESFTAPAAIFAGPILKGTGQVLGKSFNFVGNVLNKAKASYITDEVAPKAFNVYKNNVEKFTPEIQNYAKIDLGVPDEAIQTIRSVGVKNIDEISNKHGKSTDPIYQKIQEGIIKKEKEVEDAYSRSFSNMGKGGVIHVTQTKKSMGKMLREYGYIDKNNKETAFALNDTIENSPLKRILNFYKALDPNKTEGFTALNSSQWNLFRNNLSKLSRQDKSLSKNITGILDSLHADAERAGLKGISNARNLARANFQAEENILNSALIKERKLDNYFKLSESEKRQLKSIEDFTGSKFIDDLKAITSGKYLGNIREGKTIDNFVRDLNSASDRKMTNHIMKEYSKILGKENASNIFKEIVNNRRLGIAKRVAGYTGAASLGASAVQEIRSRLLR